MGKAGRRKKNRQKRKQQLSSDPINATVDENASNVIVNPQSAVQRLRHADPKVRHAALVALQASVLSQARCASHKPVSIKVLQAVREQVTSNDLECSAVAAECLAQYLQSVSSNLKHANNSDQQKQTIASWALVLLGRLNDCRQALEEQKQQQQDALNANKSISKNQQKKAEKIKKRWYAVSAPCLIALCQLIEDNGHALDQINLQKKTFVQVVFGILSLECDNAKAPIAATADDTAMKDDGDDEMAHQQDVIFAKLRDTTALYSARCLHSALDDNWELAEALGSGEQNQQLWINLLGKFDGRENHLLSTMTRLHLIGCLVNLYQLSRFGNNPADSTWYEKAIVEFGIRASQSTTTSEGLLLEVLLSNKSNQDPSASLLQLRLAENEARYRTAQTLYEKQTRDQQMEEEVDAQVKERKEPAKLIARRQKKVKEAKREAFREQQKAKMIAEAEATNDADMMDNSDNDEEEPKEEKSGKIIREQDGEEAKNEAMLEWLNTTGPIQLGLEIFTNLVSTWISSGDDPMSGGGGGDPKSTQLFQITNEQNMTARLAQTFQTLSQFLRTSQVAPEDPIRSDAEETIGKVAACVCNCFLTEIFNSRETLWEVILSDLHTELGQTVPSEMVLDAGSSILAVAAEMDPMILRASNSADQFALFRRLLPRADAVCLLSAIIRLETAEVAKASAETEVTVRGLTENFLALLRPTSPQSVNAKTQTSILKAFMDWYGNDDFYPHMYESLGVSEVIGLALESIGKNQNNLDLDEEQLQILHNSGRFLDYKEQFKLQLQARR